ncbi:hypothetical protein EVAR_26031_1 [Eumeta japonica]|uniref:Uncharacterized protein n=1 Tax=Eumeta variegata TaxID=151549 RepID=A0A4C1VR03_EUMVA|nr:hypothetical protein EVAR_26031_1 [Eumeta japonica]
METSPYSMPESARMSVINIGVKGVLNVSIVTAKRMKLCRRGVCHESVATALNWHAGVNKEELGSFKPAHYIVRRQFRAAEFVRRAVGTRHEVHGAAEDRGNQGTQRFADINKIDVREVVGRATSLSALGTDRPRPLTTEEAQRQH